MTEISGFPHVLNKGPQAQSVACSTCARKADSLSVLCALARLWGCCHLAFSGCGWHPCFSKWNAGSWGPKASWEGTPTHGCLSGLQAGICSCPDRRPKQKPLLVFLCRSGLSAPLGEREVPQVFPGPWCLVFQPPGRMPSQETLRTGVHCVSWPILPFLCTMLSLGGLHQAELC